MRKILPVAATAAMALTFFAPGTANAGTTEGTGRANCPAGDYCAWDKPGFDGERRNWYGDDHNYWGDGFNDRTSSVQNNGTSGPGVRDNVRVFTGGNESGDYGCVAPGQSVGDMNPVLDNAISAHSWDFGNNCEFAAQ